MLQELLLTPQFQTQSRADCPFPTAIRHGEQPNRTDALVLPTRVVQDGVEAHTRNSHTHLQGCLHLRACLSVRFQGLTSPPEYQPSAPSRLRPAKRAALCLPDPCGLGSDSHDGKVFSGKLLKSLTQTGSQSRHSKAKPSVPSPLPLSRR